MGLGRIKANHKIIIFILVSMIIILSSAIYIHTINSTKTPTPYKAEGGVMDLSNWDRMKNLNLDGEWEFYPNLLLNPSEEKLEEYKDVRKYVNVPGSWESYLNEDGRVDGAGTYRLRIKLPKDGIYGIKTRTIRLSGLVFINGEEVISAGKPAYDRNNAASESRYKIGFAKSDHGELDLIVQVSSYKYRSGGIIKSIEFGRDESIIKHDRISRTMEGFIISICLVLSIYFFLTYLQRRNDKFLAYFSGSNFFMGIYLSIMNEQLLNILWNYSFVTRLRIQIFSMVMVTVCFLRFVYFFFEEYRNKIVIHSITSLVLLNLLFVLNNPIKDGAIPQKYVQLILIIGFLISYSYVIYILIRAICNKIESSGYIIIIASSMITYWVVMACKMIFEIELGYLPAVLISIMLITVAMLMSHRLQLDYQAANNLSRKLISYDKLKDEFLATASHELRTPLHVILNLSQSLIEGKKGTLNPNQQEDLFFIIKEGNRLTRLVEDLLDASQFNNEKTQIRIEALNPHRVVDSILEEMNLLIPNDKNIVLINDIPQDFPRLKADPDKFIQITYNLVYNSIKYTDSGEIRLAAYLEDGQGIIEVKDTGLGIKPEDLEEIFDVFYRSEEGLNMESSLGLGLPIAKHLVEIQGGDIQVESVYGQGSSFSFSLPLYIYQGDEVLDRSEKVDRSPSSTKTAKKEILLEKELYNNIGKQTILIVDDEVSNQKVMANIISEMGFSVLFADNGTEAINYLDHSKIDLIVLDFMLPDISGDEVCKRIRQKYSVVELPILVLTASGRNIDLLNAFEYGANDFLKKPADALELKSRIQSLLLMKTSVEEGLNKEFQYFYSQISPHFLYNTLNTIIGLSYKDDEQARKALNNLSIYLRGKLDVHIGENLISLEEELELVTAYLEIEQMRYGEGLKIEYDIEKGVAAMIPPLTLQPLVENSIRHGLVKRDGSGWIKISVKRKTEDYLMITIEDNGVGISVEKQRKLIEGSSERVGFRNIVEKLKILKGASIELESEEGKGTKITILVPEVKSYEGYVG